MGCQSQLGTGPLTGQENICRGAMLWVPAAREYTEQMPAIVAQASLVLVTAQSLLLRNSDLD